MGTRPRIIRSVATHRKARIGRGTVKLEYARTVQKGKHTHAHIDTHTHKCVEAHTQFSPTHNKQQQVMKDAARI